MITNFIFTQLMQRVAAKRPPNFVVGADDPQGAYLRRWYLLPRNRFLNVYLHHFLRDDDDRALHDHPWAWASLLLRGSYIEHTIAAGGVHHKRARNAGSLKFSLPSRAHRIELAQVPDPDVVYSNPYSWTRTTAAPCWTLFITGPRVRDWGFHCPDQGWIHFLRFTKPGSVGERGPGCDA